MVDASPRLCDEGPPIGIPPAPREGSLSEALQLHKFSISVRRSSFVLPSFCSRRPRSSSSFPSANARSLSVNCPYFCFSLPFTSFQLPLNCKFVIVINASHATHGSVVFCKKEAVRARGDSMRNPLCNQHARNFKVTLCAAAVSTHESIFASLTPGAFLPSQGEH